MKVMLFYLKQVLLLGSVGFVAFVARAWWEMGAFWLPDTPQAWVFALVLIAVYLIVVATPLQLICRYFSTRCLSLVIGLISGPFAVVVGFTLFTKYPFTFESYVNRALFRHSTFALIGVWFAYNFQGWLGPNNSFKPNPHQGGA